MTAHPARLREARESSYSSRARVVAYLNEQSLNVAQAPHPNHRKVWLTQQSGPLPEGEGEGRARRHGLRRNLNPRSISTDSVKLLRMLPEGEGSPRAHAMFRIHTRIVQTPATAGCRPAWRM